MAWAVSGLAALIYWGLSLRPGHSWARSVVKGLAVLPLVPLALGQGAPVVALALTLWALNFLGDGLRDALDPRLKNK